MIKKYNLILMLLLIVPVSATFITDEDKATSLKQQDTLLIREKYRALDQKQKRQKKQAKRAKRFKVKKTKAPTANAKSNAKKYLIKKIQLRGVTKLNKSDQYFILENYIDQKLSIQEIHGITRDITNKYIELGYITTRAYIPKQSISKGNLVIKVVEGRIEDIRFKNGGHALQLWMAFGNINNKILNIREIEQGLDQLNTLPHAKHTMSLMGGTALGKSIIVVSKPTRPYYSASFSYDNNTAHSQRIYPYSISFQGGNVMSLSETYRMSMSQEAGQAGQASAGFSGGISLPFGFSTMGLSYSLYEYTSLLTGTFSNFLSSGKSESIGASLQQTLYKTRHSKTTLSLGLSIGIAKSYLEDVELESGTRKLSVVSAGLSHSWQSPVGQLSGGISASQGTKLFEATRDSETDDQTVPQSQYKKLNLNLGYSNYLRYSNLVLTFSSAFSAQYSPDTLYSTSRLSLGSLYTVRGFRSSGIQGDMGWYWRQEIGMPMGRLLPGIQCFMGYDTGYAKKQGGKSVHGEEGEGFMTGIAAGFRVNQGALSLDVTIASPLYAPDYVERSSQEIYANLSMEIM